MIQLATSADYFKCYLWLQTFLSEHGKTESDPSKLWNMKPFGAYSICQYTTTRVSVQLL